MPPVPIVTSPLAADVLRIALARRGVPSEAVALTLAHAPHGPDEKLEPTGVCLQPGGLRAFREMGLDIEALAAQSTVVPVIRVVHPKGHRLIRLDLSGLSSRYPMLVIATPVLRAYLATAAQASGIAGPGDAPRAAPGQLPAEAWKLMPCPGILLRTVRGSFRDSREPLLWDHARAYLCVGQLPHERLVLSAMPLFEIPIEHQRTACQAALDDATERLRDHFSIEGPVEEQWFSLPGVGARPCRDGHTLRWSSAALRLHPITGMSISYWAIQANRLAEELARSGHLSDRFVRSLDANNRWMVRRNLLSLNVHLRPAWWRSTCYGPCLWALQHSDRLRRVVFRRLWLT